MNINNLEKLARQVLRDNNNNTENSETMVRNGVITPAEHRSLKSLSWQIAANVQANTATPSTVAISVRPMKIWF